MIDQRISITITVTEDGFFTNASHEASFICTTLQPTLDLSLASAMPTLREYVELALTRIRDSAPITFETETVTLRVPTGLASRIHQLLELPAYPSSIAVSAFQPVLDTLNGTPAPASDANLVDLLDLDTLPSPEGESHSDQQTWIGGLGWVNLPTICCIRCGDSGRIDTGWSDEGDPENGPCLVVTDWEYCTCSAGSRERFLDASPTRP